MIQGLSKPRKPKAHPRKSAESAMTDQASQIRRLQAENEALRDALLALQDKFDHKQSHLGTDLILADTIARVNSIAKQHQELNYFLDTILDQSPFALWVSDASGTVIRTNQALRDALHLRDEQVVGEYNVLNDGNLELHGVMDSVKAVFDSHTPTNFIIPWKVEHVEGVDFEGGKDLYIDVSMFPIVNKDGLLTNVVCQWVDITELKQLEAHLREAKEGAETANKAKSEFLANISHELRTPLTPIMGFTELILLDDNLTEDQTQLLNIVNQRSQDLLRLLNDILDIAKIEANKLTIRPSEVDVHKLAQDVIGLYDYELEPRNLSIQTTISPQLEGLVWIDPVRLRQILLNLIGNAVKHAEASQIDVELDLIPPKGKNGRKLQLTVRDDGCGIPEEYKELIFESFQQIDASLTRSSTGVGLGLAICKRLAQLMGGQITVESEVGQGSRFTVTLDLSQKKNARAHPKENSPKAKAAENVLVLLVEDDKPSATFTRLVLNRMGYQCQWVNNGEAAIEASKSKVFDLILMDMRMPEMNGLETTRAIRENEGGHRHIPIVALTANAFDEDRDACLQAGMDDWLCKPVSMEKMQSVCKFLAN